MAIHKEAPSHSDLAASMDELALQVMLKGAAAFRSKALGNLIKLAAQESFPALAAELGLLCESAKKKTLSNNEAKSAVAKLAAELVPAPNDGIDEHADDNADILAFDEDPELLADFILEADEHLISIEEKILLLEKDPTLIESIHAVFRSFHSIKGLAGFLGLAGVQAVSHEVETLLDHARNLRISVDTNVVDLVLESSEYLKEEVARIRAKLAGLAEPPVRDNAALIETLMQATSDVAAGRSLSSNSPKADAIPIAEPLASKPVTIIAEAAEETLPQPTIVETEPGPVVPSPAEVQAVAPATVPTHETDSGNAARGASPASERQPRGEVASTSIRVETSKLDRLMDMVGEMVIAQSILSNLTLTGNQTEVRLHSEMSQLARITSEVQHCAMSMRMMPIGPLFQKNAKMVRDLSRRHNKQVNLELLGEATELDKTIAEELSDPLLHMIRNALDHGIELPEERTAAGKPPIANLRIAAEHEAGQIVISISDDGRGLDSERIRAKAVEKGLIDEAAHLSEDEIFHLIFAPGFSTAEIITDISGRGVGMDVVRQHVESLRGRIEIRSELGKGTTFLIHLPLTLAIIEGLVIVVGEQRYIIPLFSVREMLRPTQEMLFTVQGAEEMILMRGNLLPLVRLHKRFSMAPRSENICDGLLVVCEFSGKRFCLFVDDLLGRQEVVIKSLDEAFKTVRGVSGSAILGDGRIGLILDVAGIFTSTSHIHEVIAV